MLHVVQQASGGCDKHVHPPPEGAFLWSGIDASEDRGSAKPGMLGKTVDVFGYLGRKLACRGQHEGSCRAAPSVHQAIQNRQSERRRFARSRGRGRQDVAVLQQWRDGKALDGRGRFEAQVLEPVHQIMMQVERIEGSCGNC